MFSVTSGVSGASWSALGASWRDLGRLLGAFGTHLGIVWEVPGVRKAFLMRITETLKILEKRSKVLQKSRFGVLEISEKMSSEGKLGSILA